MELTLKRLLEQAKFTTTRKGYDQQEVDDFLDRAVAMATKVEARLTQALADAGKAPGSASGAPARSEEELRAEITAEVERKLEARLAEARAKEPQPQGVDPEVAAEEAARTLVLAQRTADAAVTEARQEAEALLEQARTEAAEISSKATADAEQERVEARGRLLEEIRTLEGSRDNLRTDVSVLEGHVEEQRLQLRSTVAELQRLLDDPATFRLAPAPEVREVEIPGADDLPPSDGGSTTETVADPSSPGAHRVAGGSDATPSEPGPGGGGDDTIDLGGDPAPDGPPSLGGADADDRHEPLSIDVPAATPPAAGGTTGPSDPPRRPGADAAAEADDILDVGPPTAPVEAVDLDFNVESDPVSDRADTAPPAGPSADATDNDDAFLAELRKAMADEEPLGPRDPGAVAPQPGFLDEERRGWRFGKRR